MPHKAAHLPLCLPSEHVKGMLRRVVEISQILDSHVGCLRFTDLVTGESAIRVHQIDPTMAFNLMCEKEEILRELELE